MKPKRCPSCKSYMSEDDKEYWCDYCDYFEEKQITTNWKWSDE